MLVKYSVKTFFLIILSAFLCSQAVLVADVDSYLVVIPSAPLSQMG